MPTILMILTSHGDLGGQGRTGFYASEAADPWVTFTQAGYRVDVVTVGVGTPPVDGRDDADRAQQRFFAAVDLHHLRSLRDLGDDEISSYAGVFLPGGHGTMWDFPHDEVASTVSRVWTSGGVVAAVCHGPAGLLGATIEGRPLVEGRRVTGFSNAEEHAVGLEAVVPFLLHDALVERGGRYVAGDDFTEHVIVDDRLVTGQNPQSAHAVAHAMLEVLARPHDNPQPEPETSKEGLVWVITGASSGFGAAIARQAAQQGDRVLATARDTCALNDLTEEFENVCAARLDVTDAAQVRAACDEALRLFGRIDVLVNNAGYGLRGVVEEWDLDEARQQWETNVLGPVLTTRAVLPTMRAQGSGWIVQLSSVGGVSATLGGTAYATSKFALEGLSEGLAAEVSAFGIDVTLLEPGPFRTDFSGRSTRWSPTLPQYRDILKEAYSGFRAQDGKQPNSPERAAQIIVDLAHSPQRPLRLPMGPESFDRIRTTLTERLKDLPALEEVARDTAYSTNEK